MGQEMVGRCDRCGAAFELPLRFDPLTLRTTFDIQAMAEHQAEHQLVDRLRQNPSSEA